MYISLSEAQNLIYSSFPKGVNQFSSVTQSCPTLCVPVDCSTPGLSVHHQHPGLAQTRVHRVGDAIQPSHPLSSPSPPAFKLSQHQGLFQRVSSPHQVAKVKVSTAYCINSLKSLYTHLSLLSTVSSLWNRHVLSNSIVPVSSSIGPGIIEECYINDLVSRWSRIVCGIQNSGKKRKYYLYLCVP